MKIQGAGGARTLNLFARQMISPTERFDLATLTLLSHVRSMISRAAPDKGHCPLETHYSPTSNMAASKKFLTVLGCHP